MDLYLISFRCIESRKDGIRIKGFHPYVSIISGGILKYFFVNINQTIHKRLLSFKYAFNGLKVVFKEEYNLKIHFITATLVTISSLLIHINTNEWLAIILSIGMVISSEILN